MGLSNRKLVVYLAVDPGKGQLAGLHPLAPGYLVYLLHQLDVLHSQTDMNVSTCT